MDKETLIVDGFEFPSYKEAQIALKEQQNIEVIRKRIEISDSEAVHELYCKLMERDMFKTMVGYSFLYELRYCLITEHGYEAESLPVIHLPKRLEYDKVSEFNKGVMETKIQDLLLVKKKQTIVIVALIFLIVAMFVIAVINPDVHYVNTENKILNKYATWQEELEQREQAVKEKEEELNIK